MSSSKSGSVFSMLGAIMVSSLLYMDKSEWERYEAVTETWQHLAGMSRRPHIQ